MNNPETKFILEPVGTRWRYRVQFGPRHKGLVSDTYCNLEACDKAARVAMDNLRNRERPCRIVSPKGFHAL